MSRDILEVMREVAAERAAERVRFGKINKVATMRLYLGYAVKVLDLILDISYDRRNNRFDW